MQATDAQLIETLRVRCATQGMLMNQSEVARVGLRALADMSDEELKDRQQGKPHRKVRGATADGRLPPLLEYVWLRLR